MGVKWYFIVILIYTSLIVVLHLFICCLPNSVSLEKTSFHLCPLKKWFVCFLLLIYGSYLHILDINPLLDTWFTNMFFHSIGCLFTVDCVFWCTDVSNFDVIQFICFYFCFLCFWCHVQETVAMLNVIKYLLLLYFKSTYLVILKVLTVVSLYFCNYCLVYFTTWFTICIFSLTIYHIKFLYWFL